MKRISFDLNINLKNYFDEIFSKKNTQSVLDFYSNKFNIPEDISILFIKQRISRCFIMRSKRFDKKLNISYIFISVVKYALFLIYSLIFSRVGQLKSKDYELLIDGPFNGGKLEINRWKKLEIEFNSNKTIYISKGDISGMTKLPNNVAIYRDMRNYDRKILIQLFFKSFFYDVFFTVKNSFYLGINLVHIHTLYVNDYLYYSNVFKECRAKFMIQDRNLGMTNALKNYLFIDSGGIFSSCIQKNIVQHNANSLFFDIDILFSLGDETAEDLFDFGARINTVLPVGSLAMETYKNEEINNKNEIDVLYIGINAVSAKKENYDSYYDSVEWLANLSITYPGLKIYIKHHLSWNDDPVEFNIIKKSNIRYLNKKVNSYQLSFQSKLIVTYGSTMGYELIGLGKKVIFFDPNNDNPFLTDSLNRSKNVLKDYNIAKSLFSNIDEIDYVENTENYCSKNTNVSKSIFQNLIKMTQ